MRFAGQRGDVTLASRHDQRVIIDGQRCREGAVHRIGHAPAASVPGIRQAGIAGNDTQFCVDGHHRALDGDKGVLVKSARDHDGDGLACEIGKLHLWGSCELCRACFASNTETSVREAAGRAGPLRAALAVTDSGTGKHRRFDADIAFLRDRFNPEDDASGRHRYRYHCGCCHRSS